MLFFMNATEGNFSQCEARIVQRKEVKKNLSRTVCQEVNFYKNFYFSKIKIIGEIVFTVRKE